MAGMGNINCNCCKHWRETSKLYYENENGDAYLMPVGVCSLLECYCPNEDDDFCITPFWAFCWRFKSNAGQDH